MPEQANQTKLPAFELAGERTFRSTLSGFRFRRLQARVRRNKMPRITLILDPDASGHRYHVTFLLVEVIFFGLGDNKRDWTLRGFATRVVEENGEVVVDRLPRWLRPAVDCIEVSAANQGKITFNDVNHWWC